MHLEVTYRNAESGAPIPGATARIEDARVTTSAGSDEPVPIGWTPARTPEAAALEATVLDAHDAVEAAQATGTPEEIEEAQFVYDEARRALPGTYDEDVYAARSRCGRDGWAFRCQ